MPLRRRLTTHCNTTHAQHIALLDGGLPRVVHNLVAQRLRKLPNDCRMPSATVLHDALCPGVKLQLQALWQVLRVSARTHKCDKHGDMGVHAGNARNVEAAYLINFSTSSMRWRFLAEARSSDATMDMMLPTMKPAHNKPAAMTTIENTISVPSSKHVTHGPWCHQVTTTRAPTQVCDRTDVTVANARQSRKRPVHRGDVAAQCGGDRCENACPHAQPGDGNHATHRV